MYDCKAPLSRFYYPDTRRIINAFIIIIYFIYVFIRAGTNTPSDEYDTYRDTGWRIRYVSRIHFFSEAKLGNG